MDRIHNLNKVCEFSTTTGTHPGYFTIHYSSTLGSIDEVWAGADGCGGDVGEIADIYKNSWNKEMNNMQSPVPLDGNSSDNRLHIYLMDFMTTE